jgi:divalent metal cation (Fe/Co/Zn/Cd) transporter
MEYTKIDDDPKDIRLERALSATRASWVVNWLLFFVKLYVVIFSRSKSVIASLVDSAGMSSILLLFFIIDESHTNLP